MSILPLMLQDILCQKVITEDTIPDSLIIISSTDEMDGKTTIYPSKSIFCVNENETIGFKICPFIEPDFSIKDLYVKMFNIGNCAENNELILLLDDGSRIIIKSWNKFNCDGVTYFRLNQKDKSLLRTRKIIKAKVTNGYSFDSFTGEVDSNQQDYFIKIAKMLDLNQFFVLKK
ncbi:MAG TPA: hypothetical protein PKI15_04045 [Candidatus Cloacimonadota bacterium]|nr:hypothetical protein [Candidatus Cloacimonadota bacterium]